MKYIVLKARWGEIPVLFPDNMMHAEVGVNHDIISGGFVWLKTTKEGRIEATAYGESASVGVSSRTKDSDLITAFLNPNPMSGALPSP